MRAFSEVGSVGQLRRLRRLVSSVMDVHWPALRGGNLSVLQLGENATFRLDHPMGRFVVRVHRPQRHDAAELESEATWVRALRRDTELEVPVLVPTAEGRHSASGHDDLVDDPRLCTVITWTAARARNRGLNASHTRRIGALMARLQLHSEGFERPANFTRPAWDIAGLLHAQDFWGDPLEAPRRQRDRIVIADALDRIRERLLALQADPTTHGLIHADLHHGNVLWNAEGAHPIDFDDCGFGFWLYDLACAAVPLHELPGSRALVDGLLDGYRQARGLDPAHWDHYPDMYALRAILIASWTAFRGAENPVIAATLPDKLAHAVATASEYCRL